MCQFFSLVSKGDSEPMYFDWKLREKCLKKELDYDKGLLLWKDMQESELKAVFEALEGVLEPLSPQGWAKQHLGKMLGEKALERGNRGWLLWPLRVALTGKKSSAPPFEIAEILGKEKNI